MVPSSLSPRSLDGGGGSSVGSLRPGTPLNPRLVALDDVRVLLAWGGGDNSWPRAL